MISQKENNDDAFLQYGFTSSSNNEQTLLCLVCNETLSAESMKPFKLKRHFESRPTHNGVAKKYFFLNRVAEQKSLRSPV